MKKFLKLASACLAFLFVWQSCGQTEKDMEGNIVINEIMPSNRTGLQLNGKNPAAWIEIKNLGKDSINLEGCKIVVDPLPPNVKSGKGLNDSIKDNDAAANDVPESIKNDDEDGDAEEGANEWTFPEVKIGGGQCLIVFAKKTKGKNAGNPLHADLKLPKKGATVKILSPKGNLLSEVTYGLMEPDQAYVLQNDSSYVASYWQSPGFENTRQGYESAMQKIESGRKSPLLIWEVMSRAQHSYDNWLELKNVSDKPLDISEYKLAKKPGKKEGWALPSRTLAPGEIISIQLAGGKANKNNPLQADFKIGDAESVVLTKNREFVDGVNAKLSPFGGSVGRQKGKKGFYFFSKPSRNAENGEGFSYIAEKPVWDTKPGIYKDTLVLRLKNKDLKVHYTLNGSEPTLASPVFKDSIILTKPTVVRSIVEGDSVTMQSPVATASYMIGIEHTLPVVNISLDNGDLYDHNRGIYANGPGYNEEFPHSNANFWKNWTKKAYIEIFDDEDGFASDCGLKIFGGYSRALPKKSFRIKFRGEFGDAKVNYDFFDTGEPMEFEDIVLRSGSQDYSGHMLKDEFFTSLVQSGSPTVLTQMYRPVALYVNGEYFGLYYLREKIDKNFVARKFNAPSDSVDMGMTSHKGLAEIVNKIASLDMRKKENYEFAKQHIDMQSLIDFKIGNIYSQKTDLGNTRYARARDKGSDNKWHYIYYDIDYSWSPSGKPSAMHYLSMAPGAIVPEKARYNLLISKLLPNPEFRQLFLERLSYQLTNTYSAKNATAFFDKFVDEIRPEMKHNAKRWPKLSYEKWEKNIQNFRSRFENRPKVVLNELRDYLHITPEEEKKYFSHLGY